MFEKLNLKNCIWIVKAVHILRQHILISNNLIVNYNIICQ